MRLIGITPVRNEDWIIDRFVRSALLWLDELIILAHCCTDNTLEILSSEEWDGRLTVITEPDPIWREMAHRQLLLSTARSRGATHIAMIDADEILSANAIPIILGAIKALPLNTSLQAYWAHPWRSLSQYRCDSRWSAQYASLAFADSPELEWHTRDGYDHHHREPFGITSRARLSTEYALIHLQHAHWPRVLAKQALYKMIERTRWPDRETVAQVDRKYSVTVDETGIETKPMPAAWLDGITLPTSSEPWQKAECYRLLDKHGPQAFHGLDLFGII